MLVPYYDDPGLTAGPSIGCVDTPGARAAAQARCWRSTRLSETFRLMPRPPEGPEPTMEAMSDLLQLDGELSVATIYRNGNGTTLDVWALQD
jgi:hypothetical protein